MAWVKVDDRFPDHRKWHPVMDNQRLYHECMAVWLIAMCFCNSHLTDGLVPKSALISASKLAPKRARLVLKTLVDLGFILDRGRDGYELTNYLEYQPSRSKTLEDREKERRRKEAYRAKDSAECPGGTPGGSGPDVIGPDPDPVPHIDRDIGRDPKTAQLATVDEVKQRLNERFRRPNLDRAAEGMILRLLPIPTAELDQAIAETHEKIPDSANAVYAVKVLNTNLTKPKSPTPIRRAETQEENMLRLARTFGLAHEST